ncbi:hypothetical protein OG21DRAFT_1511286 [Imleria badia]|nr:hypothetical protein OG21DRAFT_1511286 [Imleria badia]
MPPRQYAFALLDWDSEPIFVLGACGQVPKYKLAPPIPCRRFLVTDISCQTGPFRGQTTQAPPKFPSHAYGTRQCAPVNSPCPPQCRMDQAFPSFIKPAHQKGINTVQPVPLGWVTTAVARKR